MAETLFRGSTVHTVGELPAVGTKAPDFTLTGADLGEVSLSDFAGRRVVRPCPRRLVSAGGQQQRRLALADSLAERDMGNLLLVPGKRSEDLVRTAVVQLHDFVVATGEELRRVCIGYSQSGDASG